MKGREGGGGILSQDKLTFLDISIQQYKYLVVHTTVVTVIYQKSVRTYRTNNAMDSLLYLRRVKSRVRSGYQLVDMRVVFVCTVVVWDGGEEGGSLLTRLNIK